MDLHAEETKTLSGWAADYNPRSIDPDELRDLAESIKTFGFVEPIVVNRRSKPHGWPAKSNPAVVGGHQRVRAAARSGCSNVQWSGWTLRPGRRKS